MESQNDYLNLETRKFRRRGLLAYFAREQELLREELVKREQQLETAHKMLLRHQHLTQELECRQQKAIHALKEEQVGLESRVAIGVVSLHRMMTLNKIQRLL